MIFAFLLLFTAATRVELIPSQTIVVPAHNWRYYAIDLRQRPALVEATFAVQPGSGAVRMALLRRSEMEQLREEYPAGALVMTEMARSGRLRHQVVDAGDYALVLDNRSEARPAAAWVNVWVDFAEPPGPRVVRVSSGRRAGVVLLGCAFFLGVAIFSARRLRRAMAQSGARQ